MKNTCISHKPGDIVQLAGIDFVVLEDRGPFNGEGENHDLFILALEGQGESRFGDTNNYAESDLKGQVEGWLYRLTEKMAGDGRESDIDLIRTRTISLTTLDGYKVFGKDEGNQVIKSIIDRIGLTSTAGMNQSQYEQVTLMLMEACEEYRNTHPPEEGEEPDGGDSK